MIPIAAPHIGAAEKQKVMEVLSSGNLAQGRFVSELEKQFARFCGCKHAIAVSSGTAAIHASLYAAGIVSGDEVITVPFTFVATANPILMQGAKIVFSDIESETYNIDPGKIDKLITDKTKAIITVDLYGQPCDYDAIRKVAKAHDLVIIEDACQAVGAKYRDTKTGNLGDISAFSLYATKNIMSGEGGLITTNNSEYAKKCRRFRHHGQTDTYEYHDIGYNYRLTDIQAAIALCQLAKVDDLNNARIRNSEILTVGLKKIKGLKLPKTIQNATHVFHQYTIRVQKDFSLNRDQLLQHLRSNGIGASIYYPKPLHMHPHFIKMGYKEGDFPIAEDASANVISLPVHPGVTEKDISKIIKVIHNA